MSEAKFKFGDRVRDGKHGLGFIGAYSPDIGLPYLVCFECGKLMWTTGDGIEHVNPTPPPNTVPVRIAVATNVEREVWATNVGPDLETDYYMREAEDYIAGPVRISFITAHVPLPEQPAEIEGTVE